MLLSEVNGMLDVAERFWDKKREVKDKKEELRRKILGNDSRSLKQVENVIAASEAAREKTYSNISKLCKDQMEINENISRRIANGV
eukprot:scaffold29678_cov56-Cyclotella_meneghiniana.AAC.2